MMSKELSAKEQEFKRDQDKGEPGELDAMGCIVHPPKFMC